MVKGLDRRRKEGREGGREGRAYLDGVVGEPDEVEHHLDQGGHHRHIGWQGDAIGEEGRILLFFLRRSLGGEREGGREE